MTLAVSINLNSLQVIREELDNTLNQSATDFEAFLADSDDTRYLTSSREKIAQVGGTLRLLECYGAALLADEMASQIETMEDEQRKHNDAMIEALTRCYFILPRYIEYLMIKKRELSILVIPYVNELRASRHDSLIPEYHFFEQEIPTTCSLTMDGDCQLEELLSSIGRLRHMYQVGLLGIINQTSNDFHYGLMARAVTRAASLMGDHACADVWQLAGAVLECFAAGKLESTFTRKRILADIEKLMRVIVSQGEQGLQGLSAEPLKKDLVFMLMLSNHSSPIVDAMRKLYSVPAVPVHDDDIAAEREVMQGPSLETIESVIKVLKEELRNAKDILEIASQNNGIELEDLDQLREVISRVADTLGVLNLEGPRQTLTEQMDQMERWSESLDRVDRSDFLETADAVLYVDSALAGLDRRELTVADLNEANVVARRKVIAGSQLAEAQAVVFEEAQSGVALAKRAITSYVESNFDIAHISNVATTLNTVRGALQILNYPRAAAVLQSCGEFMQDHIKNGGPGSQHHQLLETLADALISLEYYLIEVESNGVGNDKILEVAEESLAALGFAVSA